jgi:transposase
VNLADLGSLLAVCEGPEGGRGGGRRERKRERERKRRQSREKRARKEKRKRRERERRVSKVRFELVFDLLPFLLRERDH